MLCFWGIAVRFDIPSDSKYGGKIIQIIFLLISIEFGAFCLYKGPIYSPDSATYSAWAELLIQNDFNVVVFSSQANFVFSASFYALWVCLIAVLKLLLGEYWGHGVIALNLISALSLIWVSLWFVAQKTRDLYSVAIVAFCFATSIDFLNLTAYVLSDVTYAAFVAIFLNWLSRCKANPVPLSGWILAVVSLLLLMFYRPVTLPLFAVLIIAAISHPWFMASTPVSRNKLFGLLLVLALLTSALFLSHAYLMMHVTSPAEAGLWIVQLSRDYNQGMVVYQRLETYRPIPENYGDYIAISILKIMYFWAPWFQGYGNFHRLINIVNFFLSYVLVSYALILASKSFIRANLKNLWEIWVLCLTLCVFTIFHSLQQIDYDVRYRIPLLWPLYTLAGLGFYKIRSLYRSN